MAITEELMVDRMGYHGSHQNVGAGVFPCTPGMED